MTLRTDAMRHQLVSSNSPLGSCKTDQIDCNKIIRAAYGDEVWYQNLTLEAIQAWTAWNGSLEKGKQLPPGMTTKDRIYVNCGNYHIGDEGPNPFEQRSIENLVKAGLGHTQYLLGDPKEAERARSDGFGYAVDPFHIAKDGKYEGYLDAVGGFVYADKACRYALHLAQGLGVKFILDEQKGLFERFSEQPDGTVEGIITADGITHKSALTIVACGGWSPNVLPELDGLCETTAGSVATLQIPPHLTHLLQRFSPENFPVWQYKVRAGAEGNLYGFPIDEKGVIKLGYRGTKYTNPQVQPNGAVHSVPITRWTTPKSITGLPEKAIQVIRTVLDKYLPEMREHGLHVTGTRLCWYTDSYDNQFVVDAVPGKKGAMVATGGSGHAFKFLPVLGKFVVDRVEGSHDDSYGMLQRWQWRHLKKGEKPVNDIMKGLDDPNALQRVRMVHDFRGSCNYRDNSTL